MKRSVVLLLILGVPLAIVGVYFWGRWRVYPAHSQDTKYPGMGSAVTVVDKQLWINPNEGVPFFVKPDDRAAYDNSGYTITEVPTQGQVLFAVGKVVGWEDIEGSQDKYLILRHSDVNTEEKYRIAFEESPLFDTNSTVLSIERTLFGGEGDTDERITRLEESRTTNLGFDEVKRMIWRGDVVVVIPHWQPPVLSVKDERGNYVISSLILRRFW